MKKAIKFCVKAEDGKLPVLPLLHDYKVEKIEFNKNKFTITANCYSNYDYSGSGIFEYRLRTVIVEFRDEGLDDNIYGEVYVSRYYPKKQFREKTKLGYGKRSNIYSLEEFAEIYKAYGLEIIDNVVGEGKVVLFLGCNDRLSIEMKIDCTHIEYSFFE